MDIERTRYWLNHLNLMPIGLGHKLLRSGIEGVVTATHMADGVPQFVVQWASGETEVLMAGETLSQYHEDWLARDEEDGDEPK